MNEFKTVDEIPERLREAAKHGRLVRDERCPPVEILIGEDVCTIDEWNKAYDILWDAGLVHTQKLVLEKTP